MSGGFQRSIALQDRWRLTAGDTDFLQLFALWSVVMV
jgi:hypothetical protein